MWFKNGIVELGRFLNEHGVEIISTGGTAQALQDGGVPVTQIAEITGMGSVMDGRVKTLDPRIFGGILADRENPSHLADLDSLGGQPIDLIVVNFYPFVEEAVSKGLDFRKAIEYIDIGGPSMIRAAAKNFHSVVSLSDPDLYDEFKELFRQHRWDIPLEVRQKYASRVFALTAAYESAISAYFSGASPNLLSQNLCIPLEKSAELRYGENPHQKSAFYLVPGKTLPWIQHQGKELSFNNYSDMESAITIVRQFDSPACCIVKHANPCGFGLDEDLSRAFDLAAATDPVSYFGGIVGFNRRVEADTAGRLVKPFLECIIAPDFSNEALEILKKKKNLRIVTLKAEYRSDPLRIKSVAGGFLVQSQDSDQGELLEPAVATRREPAVEETAAMKLGWKLVRFVKSNAIVFASRTQLLGVGAGQMSRVDSVKIAIRKAKEAGLDLNGAAMASDAFFPFPDGVEAAADAGISAVIQPGGSLNDKKVIEKADELNLTMALTGVRHFYH